MGKRRNWNSTANHSKVKFEIKDELRKIILVLFTIERSFCNFCLHINFFVYISADNEVYVARGRLKHALKELSRNSDDLSSSESSEETTTQEVKPIAKKPYVNNL